MAEHGGAERTRDEGDAIAGERQQRGHERFALREEELGKDERGRRAVDEVVVELERRAGQAGRGNAFGRRALFGGLGGADERQGCVHGVSERRDGGRAVTTGVHAA